MGTEWLGVQHRRWRDSACRRELRALALPGVLWQELTAKASKLAVESLRGFTQECTGLRKRQK